MNRKHYFCLCEWSDKPFTGDFHVGSLQLNTHNSMELTIQISDKIYQHLLTSGCRIPGSIGLINPYEGNFNAYTRHSGRTKGTKYIRLRHGRVSINRQRVCLSLRVSLDEAGITPSEALEDESREAGDFVDDVLAMIERYH